MSSSFAFSLDQLHELHRVELRLAVVLALGVERGLEEVGVVHAGDLDRVLERHEHAFAGALVGIHLEQVLALVAAPSPPVTSYSGWPASTRASVLLPEPFGPMMACTSPAFTVQVDPLEDLLVFGLDLQILDFKHV